MATRILHFHVLLLLCLAYRLGFAATSFPGDRMRLDSEHRPSRTTGDSSSDERGLDLNQGNNAAGKRKHASNYEGLLDNKIIRNPFNIDHVSDDEPSKAGDRHGVLFVFGDSLFDGGNNKYINDEDYYPSNYPYGYTFFTNATGRICDGRVVPDFIADYADLPLIPPSVQPGADFSYGANFASGGSAVLDSDGETNFNVINLREQVSQFKEMVSMFNETLGPIGAREMFSKAVYLFSTGGNDYLHFYQRFNESGRSPTQSEQKQFVKSIVGNITDVLLDIYELGARKIAFQNVGPMGCVPAVEISYSTKNGSCIQQLLSIPILHNEELYRALTVLAEHLDGFKFATMDYFSSLYARIIDPWNYGFDFGRTFCYNSKGDTLCEYPSAYVFFDDGHTSQRANEQFAKLIWSGDPSVTRPYNVKQLFEED